MEEMMTEWFVFQARLGRVVDGDTIDVVADLGFRSRRVTRCRLVGVDTAEIYGVTEDSEEYQRGIQHKQFVANWFGRYDDGTEWPFVLDTQEDHGKYGRWPAFIEAKLDRSKSLNLALKQEFPEVVDDE